MLNHPIPELDRLGLRNFGLTFAVILAALFGLAIPFLFSHKMPLWPWVVATVMCLWSLLLPNTLKLVYKLWMKFGLIAGFINTRIILFILFFFIFFPVGLVMRLFGNDPMARKLSGREKTYRVKSTPRDKKHFERPY